MVAAKHMSVMGDCEEGVIFMQVLSNILFIRLSAKHKILIFGCCQLSIV
jgi:hypothetical protein